MDFNLIDSIKACQVEIPPLLYYSHIPTAIISMLIGLFVFFKNRNLISKILLSLSTVFTIWLIFNLIAWISIDGKLIMFIWSFFGMLMVSLFALCFYFVYVFINKKDMRWQLKIILLIIILPFILLNKENTSGFDLTNCEAIEKTMYSYAVYFFELFFSLWILIYAIYKYKKVDSSMQKQIIFLIIGIEFFLFSFFVTGYISSILTVNSYNIEFYGLFGMTFFMGMLAYLIVRFEAFNIKMIGAQALVVGLVILIGSQFFFIRSFINQILTGITLALSIVFGWALIHSVKLEVERKNELQRMSNSLALANDKLRKLDNAKSEFISIASHQLRTPLTAIKGFISLILEDSYGKVSAEIRDVLNKVYISNERLIELVEDLLNLSRIESGRMEYTFEKTNFNELCQEIYDTFALRAKEKELRLELVLPQNSTAEAVTDRSKVREVISNMVDNALKYTIKGGVKMKVSENERNILVAIIDTGIGVPEEEIPYLFSKFSRGKDINRLNAGGTGLGLHVARKVMEAVGGRIWVESAGTNLGSTFFLEIPKEHAEIN